MGQADGYYAGKNEGYYAGKKKRHTLKGQVVVDGATEGIVDVPASVPGPTAAITLLKQSGLLGRLSPDCDVDGALGYLA